MSKLDFLMALYRSDFAAFNRFAFRELHPGTRFRDTWHIDLMADRLAKCARREARRLIINVPPRSLKSHSASVALPVWMLGRNPRLKIISAAGSRELASDLEEATRQLMASDRLNVVFPHLKPQGKPGNLRLAHGGRRTAGVVGRSLIGRGADMIIIDDPLSPKGANDDKARNEVNEWFDAEVVSRLNDKANGIIIVVMQRLHPHDLTGHLLDGEERWEQLSLPAIATDDEVWSLSNAQHYTRHKGDALAPQIESREELRERLLQIGASNFAAQYQQAPFIPQNDLEVRCGAFAGNSENGLPPIWMGHVSEIEVLLHEVFGEGKFHPAARPVYPTEEEWTAQMEAENAKRPHPPTMQDAFDAARLLGNDCT